MTYPNVIKAATGNALITLLQACGGGGGSDSNEDNGQQAVSIICLILGSTVSGVPVII